jgi:RluA family pseudouridine synthase
MSDRIHLYEGHGAAWEGDDGEDILEEVLPTRPVRRRKIPLEILFDDPLVCVVNKPAGLPTIPTRGDPTAPTVMSELQALWRRTDPDAPPPVVCHRLDIETSGCLLLARSREVAKRVMASFRKREVRKSYLALVLGAPYPERGRIEYRLAPDRRRPGAMQLVRKGGKKCAAEYETLESFRGVSWIRVRPVTGRTHEVRLALRSLDTPCAVDPVYGGEERLLLSRWKRGYKTGRGREERPLVDRVTLHAESLALPYPSGAEDAPPLQVEAPLAKDLRTTLAQLRKHAAPGSL